LKTFTQVLSYVACIQVRRRVHKRITKRRYEEEKTTRLVFRKLVLFTLGQGFTTPYSLRGLVWIFYLRRFESQIRPTRLAINILLITASLKGRFVFVWNCLIFFRGWMLIVWPEICHVLSQNHWRFIHGTLGKNYFSRIFQKFSCKPRLFSSKTCEISPYILQFLFCVRIAQKKFTPVLLYVDCTQERRNVHKRITKRRYGEEKPARLVFEKPVLLKLGLGLTTPYSLGLLAWNFYQTFETVSIEFLLRFEPQISPTRFVINILLITVRLKGRFVCVWNCLIFFRGWMLIRLTWNLSRFVPKSLEI